MKVDPPLFPQSLGQTPAAARPSAEATEARKAFAALLSAANQRSSLPRAPTIDTPPARPASAIGRVIDIRV